MGRLSVREVRSLLEQAGERLRNLTGRELTLFQEREKRYGTGLLQAVQGAGLQPVAGLWTQKTGRITGATPFLRP